MNRGRTGRAWSRLGLGILLIIAVAGGLAAIWGSVRSFGSPEAAYHHQFLSDAALTVEGPDCVLAVGAKGEEAQHCVADRAGDRWKARDAAADISIPDPDFWLTLIRCDETGSDYFLLLEGLRPGETPEVSDSAGSAFAYLGVPEQSGAVRHNYYACIRDLGDSYVLTVDGRQYPILQLWRQITEGTE